MVCWQVSWQIRRQLKENYCTFQMCHARPIDTLTILHEISEAGIY